MMDENSLIFGWTYHQYLVAATWAQSRGYTIDWGPDITLQQLQEIWRTRFDTDPLCGAMKVYDPKVDEEVRMHVVIAWVHIASREMKYRYKDRNVERLWRNVI